MTDTDHNTTTDRDDETETDDHRSVLLNPTLPTTDVVFSKNELAFLRYAVRNAGAMSETLTPFEAVYQRLDSQYDMAAFAEHHPLTHEDPYSTNDLLRLLERQRVEMDQPLNEQLQLLTFRVSIDLTGDPEKVEQASAVVDSTLEKLTDAHKEVWVTDGTDVETETADDPGTTPE